MFLQWMAAYWSNCLSIIISFLCKNFCSIDCNFIYLINKLLINIKCIASVSFIRFKWNADAGFMGKNLADNIFKYFCLSFQGK